VGGSALPGAVGSAEEDGMIEYTTYCRIHELSNRDKLLAPQIAAELSLDERTVRFWLDEETYRPRQGIKRESKLDGFRKDIARWLDQHRTRRSRCCAGCVRTGIQAGTASSRSTSGRFAR